MFEELANPVSQTGALPVGSLYSGAALASLAPSATNPRLSNAYTESYNLNLQQDFGQGAVMEIGYIASPVRDAAAILSCGR